MFSNLQQEEHLFSGVPFRNCMQKKVMPAKFYEKLRGIGKTVDNKKAWNA